MAKKQILKQMKVGEKLRDKLSDSVVLKLGKNVINIVDDKGNLVRRKVVNHTGDESKVQKSFQDETDIKNILEKYGRTGILPIMKNEAIYGDFSEVPDYMEAQNIIKQADEQFSLLSSDLRKRFENDPAKFLEFCTNPSNMEEMIELGLAKKPAPPQEPVPVVDSSSKADGAS
jgi:phage internal scaffolding protein